MSDLRWKYRLQVQLDDGWSEGVVWSLNPSEFRNFLDFMNEGTIRIIRAPDDAKVNYYWPKDVAC